MLGEKAFGWINRRCRQATGKSDQLFGGISIILIGYPAQLPPVGDKPLYHSVPSSAVGEQGYCAYYMFNKAVILTKNKRIKGSDPEQTTIGDKSVEKSVQNRTTSRKSVVRVKFQAPSSPIQC